MLTSASGQSAVTFFCVPYYSLLAFFALGVYKKLNTKIELSGNQNSCMNVAFRRVFFFVLKQYFFDVTHIVLAL